MTLASGTPRRRGRPSVLDTDDVVAKAFRLWSTHGFAATSWQDLAAATGVSTRTLLRHFPSKSDIAWLGVEPATERLTAALAATADDVPLGDAVRHAIAESVSHEPHVQRVSADWLRLISSEPELVAMAPAAYRPWIAELAGFIGRRLPEAPTSVCRAIATAYQAATFDALLSWAEIAPDIDSADAVEEALRWLTITVPAP
ncbi:TetR family transcriptional regulator [Gordonia rubripertincta]|uniref:TetR family transcriptional regulator n=2 Tax=Gordonia rubripertincta TaxID=36822 RepID=A0AAW6R8Z4_GORRU|nr:TetR family transcriptional regulator [Gordonia rubripertincta]MDG6781232.1 TetR family transcriptional regulator [Gordonia rubripertincta]NKY62285.1 TetR family transcriptional regulator [Gordonia rubripertincta]GAB83635.1 putative TetR family transcriptional regulator [Gordonia rubripertincta NBRC 101908]